MAKLKNIRQEFIIFKASLSAEFRLSLDQTLVQNRVNAAIQLISHIKLSWLFLSALILLDKTPIALDSQNLRKETIILNSQPLR